MSAAPDPAELAPSRDPAAYGRRPRLTAGFVAWIGLCVVCLVAGAVIGRFGLTLAAKPDASSVESGAGGVPQPPAPAAVAPSVPGAATQSPASAAPADLSDRVARLESASARSAEASAQALAAAALSEAAQSAAPFDQDLAAYERLAPQSPDLRALAPLAARGAPTRGDLAASLPDLASQAAAASREPAKDASFLNRLLALVGRVVIVRRVDPAGSGVDGVLARSEAAAAAGDLEAAVTGLDGLPATARAPLDPWIAAANRRIEIDRHIRALRAGALAELAAAAGGAAP